MASSTCSGSYLSTLSLPPYPGRSTATRVDEESEGEFRSWRQRRYESGNPIEG
jgi:hypothetical protein